MYRSSYFIVDRPEQSRAVFDRLHAGGRYPQVRKREGGGMMALLLGTLGQGKAMFDRLLETGTFWCEGEGEEPALGA